MNAPEDRLASFATDRVKASRLVHFRSKRLKNWLLPPPTLRERRHRGLARRLVAVRQRAVLVISEGERL